MTRRVHHKAYLVYSTYLQITEHNTPTFTIGFIFNLTLTFKNLVLSTIASLFYVDAVDTIYDVRRSDWMFQLVNQSES